MTSKAPPVSPQFFLYGYYGFGNVGDDLLLSAVISALSRQSPQARFVVRSLNPVPDVSEARIQYVTLERIMARTEWPRWRRLASYARATWRSLHGCSHLVFGGGTLFHARSQSAVNLALIGMLVLLARLRGAKVFALGVGVAPLPPGLPKRLMGFILLLTRDFAVRDESSRTNCQALSGVSRVRLTADLVFSLPWATLPRISGPRPVLGVTLAASDIGNEGLDNESFLARLASALAYLQNRGWQIRFLSFQELDWQGVNLSDSALFATMYAYGLGQNVETIRVSSHPPEIARQYADIDVVIGMRFHGHVLAAQSGIPFIGLGRDNKLADLCAYFSMPFIGLNGLLSDHIVAAVEQVRNHAPDREKINVLSRAAAANFSHIGASI